MSSSVAVSAPCVLDASEWTRHALILCPRTVGAHAHAHNALGSQKGQLNAATRRNILALGGDPFSSLTSISHRHYNRYRLRGLSRWARPLSPEAKARPRTPLALMRVLKGYRILAATPQCMTLP
ncbi:hypothetical protein AnigIFM56816_005174 [Aspergillus niger]|nr:hypothetical protein AnigIFM56816_005174 [Aspergillus niger]